MRWPWRAESTRRQHDFVIGAPVVEPGVPAQWRRRQVRCRSCGEEGLVGPGVSVASLNSGPCPENRHCLCPDCTVLNVHAGEFCSSCAGESCYWRGIGPHSGNYLFHRYAERRTS